MKRGFRLGSALFVGALVVVLLAVGIMLFRPLIFSSADRQGLTKFLDEVQRTQKPRAIVDFTAMYGWNGRFEVLDPLFSTRTWTLTVPLPNCDPSVAVSDSSVVPRCDSLDASTANERDLVAKEAALHSILRGQRAASDSFLLTSPFLDQNGRSFAAWLFDKDIAPMNDQFWVSEHLSLFKPEELPAVLQRFGIRRENFEIIARLPKQDLRSLIEGEPAFVSGNELFIRDHSRLGFSPLNYSVYDVAKLRSSTGEFDVVASTGDESLCVERVGNICWTYNSRTTIAHLEKYAWFFFVFALAALSFAAYVYARNLAAEARERERQRLSLQVLSHEFRTPVAAMIVMLDRLRERLSSLGDEDQDAVMRISSEAFKLQRIIEMTKSYLQAGEKESKFNFVRLPSLNAWVEEFAADFDSRLRVVPLKEDRSIEADPYWLRFALANLVQNAFAHGGEPVFIRLSEANGRVSIAVEDQGACEFESLRKMAEPFEKSAASLGMGLGLNITETIVREWGGALHFEKSPTSFIISMGAR